MKKLFINVFTILLLSNVNYAQNYSPIAKLPNDANGYLVLNKANYSNVNSWKVVISQRVWNNTTNEYDLNVVQTQKLLGIDYMHIPVEYRNGNYVFTIYDSNNSQLVVGPYVMPVGPVTETLCTWYCNGPNYVYGLQMNAIPLQGVKISMQSPPQPSDAPYYYEWTSAANWANTQTGFQSNSNSKYYGFSTWPPIGSSSAGDRIVQLQLQPGQYKYDRTGWPLSGNVVGIAKYFGPYHETFHDIVSDPLAIGSGECNQPINWAINIVNQGSQNPATVVCSGTSGNDHVMAGEVPVAEIFDPLSNDPCQEEYYDYLGTNSVTNVYQVIMVPCFSGQLNTNGGGSGAGIQWPANVTRISIKSIDQIDQASIIWKQEDLFDNNGSFIGGSYSLIPGFYNIIYEYSDMSIGSYFMEVRNTITSTVQDKDFLTYSAYPVPFDGLKYNINFEATKKLGFTYEVRDNLGTLVYSENYRINANEAVAPMVVLDSNTKNGILHNKLIFDDGSEINFTTIKN